MDMNTFFIQHPGLLFDPSIRAQLSAYTRYEEEVIRVCMVYPHNVKFKAMKHALQVLGYPPHSVYMALAEGKTIPDLDELLLGPGSGKEQSR